MSNVDINETLACMRTYGGSFVKALADAYRVADHTNRMKLMIAFDNYFGHYGAMAEDIAKTQKFPHERNSKESNKEGGGCQESREEDDQDQSGESV